MSLYSSEEIKIMITLCNENYKVVLLTFYRLISVLIKCFINNFDYDKKKYLIRKVDI